LGKKKIKIELEDSSGGKYNLSLEGNISKDKILKVFEMMEILDIEQTAKIESPAKHSYTFDDGHGTSGPNSNHVTSVGSKIFNLVDSKFPYSNFTSSDILELYEDEYNEPIKLSIISTYLSRYAERGKLSRIRNRKEWVYKVVRQTGSQTYPPPHPLPNVSLSQDGPSTAYDQLQ